LSVPKQAATYSTANVDMPMPNVRRGRY